jgi:hypothetical protein
MLMKALQEIRPSVSCTTCVSGSVIMFPTIFAIWPALQRKYHCLDLPEIPDWTGIRASKKPDLRQSVLDLKMHDAAAVT